MKIVSFTGGVLVSLLTLCRTAVARFDIISGKSFARTLLAGLKALLLCRPVRRCFLLTAC